MGLPEGAYESVPQSRIKETIDDLNTVFHAGVTLDYKYRLGQLKNLRKMFLENEDKIVGAVMKDMGK